MCDQEQDIWGMRCGVWEVWGVGGMGCGRSVGCTARINTHSLKGASPYICVWSQRDVLYQLESELKGCNRYKKANKC